jgi:serine/threonine-protein kinase
MMATSGCLSDEELGRFILGDATDDELAGWEAHLARCRSCQAGLVQVQPSDALFEALRAQAAAKPQTEDEAAARIMGQLMDLPRQESLSSQPTVRGTPITLPSDGQEPVSDGSVGRYEILRELGRGGMGVVVLGHDRHMDRELALKVLPAEHRGRPQQMQRFLNEARITGRLQHPGIVPVYDQGELPDCRPYFTMKLVQGRTLAELLKERPDPAHDLPRFLAIFEHVCQAVAYAHSRGVIHRDLKPHNVMVGAFGEVQVMDWGLAKVLAQKDVESGSASLGDFPSPAETIPGEVMGTPAYMAPEQARGEAGVVDQRADVFGLGAILCDILTGRPPFTGASSHEALARARAGDHAEALARLGTCGAEGELVRLALVRLAQACLAADASARPADAGAVAAGMTAYLSGVQERLRRAELERAAAQAKAREERKRRRLALGLAAALVTLAAVGGGAGIWLLQQRAELHRGTESALVTAAGLRDAARWNEARDILEQAESRLSAMAPAGLRSRLAQARADVALARRLDEIRQKRATLVDGQFDDRTADQDYAQAFRSARLWQEGEEVEVVAARLRRSAIQAHLVAALDDWANVHRLAMPRAWLLGVASRAGSDDWGARFRDPKVWGNHDAMRRLVNEAKMAELSPQLLTTVGLLLDSMQMDAVPWWTAAQNLHPNDFWLNYHLGVALRRAKKPAEAVGYYRAALAVRPDSAAAHITLGNALSDRGQHDEAIQAYGRAIELDPAVAIAHNHLGLALAARNRLDEAIACYGRAIALDPGYVRAHENLGIALDAKGRLDEALTEFRRTIALDPSDAQAHNNLGFLLLRKDQFDEAIGEFSAALALDPKRATVHTNLGLALLSKGRRLEAIDRFRAAIDIDPRDARAFLGLGQALLRQGKFAEGAVALRRCRDLRQEGSPFRDVALRELRENERKIALDEKLSVVLSTALQPANAVECLELAYLCHYYKRWHLAAVHFYRMAFAADPKLGNDVKTQQRYCGARSAALAAAGKADDARQIPDKVVVKMRRQALSWLRDDLALYAQLAERGEPAASQMVRLRMQHWRLDADLASVRDKELDQLPDDERKEWRRLWDDVGALLQKVQAK